MRPSLSLMLCVVVAVIMTVAESPGGRAIADEAVRAVVEMVSGETISGTLESIGPTVIRLATESGSQALDVAAVRRIDCERVDVVGESTASVRVMGGDGLRLSGKDVVWEGDSIQIETPAGIVSLPVGRVQTIDWLRSDHQADAAGDPSWFQALPEDLESDIVVVTKGNETQCVPCAIAGITTDVVRVVLDGETIPVKRDRVLGLQWLREPVSAGGVIVEVGGGMLPAARVEWSPEALVVDESVRLPAACLRRVDYAAGRTTRLATLVTERLDTEPFFGSLADMEELAAAFRPRVLSADDGSPRQDLMIRPRTVAVWRVPAGTRAFTTTVARGAAAGGGALVVIAVDDREVFRATVDESSTAGAEGITIGAIPLDGARRLSITVDYGQAGPVGGVVVLRDPVFTK